MAVNLSRPLTQPGDTAPPPVAVDAAGKPAAPKPAPIEKKQPPK